MLFRGDHHRPLADSRRLQAADASWPVYAWRNKITKLVVIKDSFLIPIQPFAPSFQATITLQLLSLGRYKAAKLHPFET
jgi:hypothetical protein